MFSDKQELSGEALRSEMMLKLMVYILLHRNGVISIQELSDALWDDNETDNPAGALKNLMYRLRKVLKDFVADRECILTARGGYFWNPDIEVVLDAEQFDENCKRAKAAEAVEDKIRYYEKAIELYQGDFTAQIMDRHWAITASTYYHSAYLTAVKQLAQLYYRQEMFERMEEVCATGLKHDAVDEQLYCSYIRALIRQNKRELATKQYDQAVAVLKEALGVSNSKGLTEVYRELVMLSGDEVADNINNIHTDMVEEEKPSGVFFCGYPVFREIYRLEARKISRLGEAEYVLLVTLNIKDNIKVANEQMENFLLQKAMKQMQDTLAETLRIGDVAAKYSEKQYVVLLPTCTYESCLLVANRILSVFWSKEGAKRIAVKTECEAVTDAASPLVK